VKYSTDAMDPRRDHRCTGLQPGLGHHRCWNMSCLDRRARPSDAWSGTAGAGRICCASTQYTDILIDKGMRFTYCAVPDRCAAVWLHGSAGYNVVTSGSCRCSNLPLQSPTRAIIVNDDHSRTVIPHARRDNCIWAQSGHCQRRLTRTCGGLDSEYRQNQTRTSSGAARDACLSDSTNYFSQSTTAP
jgi:hypothetical protein